MHKFFCSYNNLTERYELTKMQGIMFSPKTNIQAENTLLPQIKNNLQSLYEIFVAVKIDEQDESRLQVLDETELLISNLYHSLFASPLDLPQQNEKQTQKTLKDALTITSLIERDINIPEYNRMIILIKNNISSLL